MTITSNPVKTKERIEQLARAFPIEADHFSCNHLNECKSSADSKDLTFYEGQSHYVDDHYDLSVNGKDIRIVVVGMSYGHGPSLVSLQNRREMIREKAEGYQPRGAGLELKFRNPHMSGTTHLLRLFWGMGLDYQQYPNEFLSIDGTPVHFFSAFALVNVLLCSATAGNSARDKATKTMKSNCLGTFLRAIEILEPTHILIEGTATGRLLGKMVSQESHQESIWLEHGEQNAKGITVIGLPHPSASGKPAYGASPRNQFLVNEIVPRMREVHEALLCP